MIRYFLPHWKLESVFLLLILGRPLLTLIPPFMMKNIIDQGLVSKDVFILLKSVFFMVVSSVLAGGLGIVSHYLAACIAYRVDFALRNEFYENLMHLSLAFHTEKRIGDMMSRMLNDLTAARNIIASCFPTITYHIVLIVSTLIVIFNLDWTLSLVSLVVFPLYIIPTSAIRKKIQQLTKKVQEKSAEMIGILSETLSNILLVKCYARESYETKRFRDKNQETMSLYIQDAIIQRLLGFLFSLFEVLGPAIIFLYGGYRTIQGTLTVGTIVAFAAYLGNLYRPVSEFSGLLVQLVKNSVMLERVFEYLDLKSDMEESNKGYTLPSVNGNIEFDHVSFKYNESQDPILNDISFSVNPGQILALVGPSGAGKTTIIKLLAHLYDSFEGRITIDGHDIKGVTLVSLREQIGIVTQETLLFNSTIRDNILYGRLDATEEEIIEAAKAAYAHDFIMELPEQYNTIVGERGVKLSGGQKQRIAIARVLLKNPSVLLLDEATSSLDSEAEAFVQEALNKVIRDRTTIVIAHRLSTVMTADHILVIDKGRIVERGTCTKLLDQGGLYRKLYEMQFRGKEERIES